MEEEVLREINKNLKWYEKIVVKVFANIFIKVYHTTRESIITKLLA